MYGIKALCWFFIFYSCYGVAAEAGKIKILTPFAINNPPRYLNDGNTIIGGTVPDFLKEIFKEEGVEFYAVPYKRAVMLMKAPKKPYDCFASVAHKLKGVPGYVSTQMLTQYHNKAIVLDSSKLNIAKIDDLKDKSILSFLGAKEHLGSEFLEMTKNNKKYLELSHMYAAIRMLFIHRVDVIISDDKLFRHHASRLGFDINQAESKVRFLPIFPRETFFLQCHSQALIKKYDARASELISK